MHEGTCRECRLIEENTLSLYNFHYDRTNSYCLTKGPIHSNLKYQSLEFFCPREVIVGIGKIIGAHKMREQRLANSFYAQTHTHTHTMYNITEMEIDYQTVFPVNSIGLNSQCIIIMSACTWCN